MDQPELTFMSKTTTFIVSKLRRHINFFNFICSNNWTPKVSHLITNRTILWKRKKEEAEDRWILFYHLILLFFVPSLALPLNFLLSKAMALIFFLSSKLNSSLIHFLIFVKIDSIHFICHIFFLFLQIELNNFWAPKPYFLLFFFVGLTWYSDRHLT